MPVSKAKPSITLSLAASDLLLFPPEGGTAEALLGQLRAIGWKGRAVVDGRRRCLRVLPGDYPSIRVALGGRYSLRTTFELRPALPHGVEVKLEARSYQQEAIEAWQGAGHRGVVVLPTGAGKTLVALLAMAGLGTTTLI